MKRQSKSKNQGFTLVELMVATSIIAILLSFSLVAGAGARKASRDGKRKADLEQIRGALEMYKADNEQYPGTTAPLDGTYIDLPSDPSIYSYDYDQTSNNTYNLCAHLETGSTTDDFCGGANDCGGNCNYMVNNP